MQSPSSALNGYLGKAAHRTIDEAEIFLSGFLEDYATRKTTSYTVVSLDAISSIATRKSPRLPARRAPRRGDIEDGGFDGDSASSSSGSDSEESSHKAKGKSTPSRSP